VIAGAAWVVVNRQAVIDFYRLQTYQAPAAVAQLAAHDKLTSHGKDLFYESRPQIQESAAFNNSCSANERTIVLGCYKTQQIFLFNVTDPRFDGVKEVTAAHEMLHAAYERMSATDQDKINALLKPIIENMKDQRILDLIALYNKQEPGQLYNEMHSILGTEYADLSPELETYYKQYFDDRSVIVGYADKYQQVFTESKAKLDEYDKQLNTLKPQIDQNNATLKQMQSELQAENNQLNQYRSHDQIQQYNVLVPSYNDKVAQFNALIDQTKNLVSQYNTIVEERNQQATAQNDLYNSIDSNYQTVQQQ
jgi:DNA repair exonuclease SbcCD ATPase subunit